MIHNLPLVLSVDEVKPGTHLGRYRLVRELGRGAMGLVFLGEDLVLREPLCVKVLHPQLQAHPEAVERFHREIVLARRIAHPGICRLYDLHREGDIAFITMEYVAGPTLRDVLIQRSPMPIGEAVKIARSICDALAAAHDVGVVHRDLKPRNIIVRETGEVSLLDFGIATALDFASTLTLPGVALGTSAYISPEVWAGKQATPKSDQWAVGVILYNCLTNKKLPFPVTGGIVSLEVLQKGAAPPSTLRPGVSSSLDAIALRALAFDPADRFADMRAMTQALAAATWIEESTLPFARTPKMASSAPDSPLSVGKPSIGEPSIVKVPAPIALGSDANQRFVDATQVDGAPVVSSPATEVGSPFIQASSASWVVGGRPVEMPVVPKVTVVAPAAPSSPPASGAAGFDATMTTTAELGALESRRDRSGKKVVAPLFALVVAAGVAAGIATLFFGDDTASEASDATATTTTTATTTATTTTTATATTTGVAPVPVVAAAPTDVAPPVVLPEGTEPDAGRDAGRDAESAPTQAAPSRKKRLRDKRDNAAAVHADSKGERLAYTQASAALNKELADRGIRPGDDAALDRARAAASASASARDWSDAAAAIEDARDRAQGVTVDRAFVERKLRRFNDAFDRETDEDVRAKLDAIATRALAQLGSGRFEAASRALNEAFALMEKRR